VFLPGRSALSPGTIVFCGARSFLRLSSFCWSSGHELSGAVNLPRSPSSPRSPGAGFTKTAIRGIHAKRARKRMELAKVPPIPGLPFTTGRLPIRLVVRRSLAAGAVLNADRLCWLVGLLFTIGACAISTVGLSCSAGQGALVQFTFCPMGPSCKAVYSTTPAELGQQKAPPPGEQFDHPGDVRTVLAGWLSSRSAFCVWACQQPFASTHRLPEGLYWAATGFKNPTAAFDRYGYPWAW